MKRVAIIGPNKNALSETFIKAHIDLLDGEVIYLYGSVHDLCDRDDNPISQLMPKPCRLWNILPVYFHHRLFLSSYYLNHINVLSNFLKRKQISVVLAEYGTTGALVWEACEKSKVPLVIHFHGFDASHLSTLQHFRTKYEQAFKYASYVIGVSKVMCQKLIALGVPPEKLIYNIYGANDAFFEITPNYLSRNFVSVGRFVDKKAPYFTILAFQKVKQRHPDARLIMAGSGELINTCMNLARHLALEIEFIGSVNHEQVKMLFSESFCFVQHSIEASDGDCEGTPVAVIEAQAAGLPVVSTFHAGIPDVIVNEETGFLVEEQAVDEMAEKMSLLFADRALAQEMGQRARMRISEHFQMQKHINQINILLDKLSTKNLK